MSLATMKQGKLLHRGGHTLVAAVQYFGSKKGAGISPNIQVLNAQQVLAPEGCSWLLYAKKLPAFLLGISIALLTASQISLGQNSPAAHELAQKVDRHYNQLHSLQAGFSESYEGMGLKRAESGTMLLVKPGRMKWEYAQPAGKLFLLDGKYAWFYARGDSQIQRIPARQLDDLRSPLRFLLGHTELEKELNSLTLRPTPQGRFTLSGQPKGQEKRIARLSLTVTADGAITAIEIEEIDGAMTRFAFTNEQPNVPIPSSVFRFTPPPGIPIVNALPPV
jgi:outer membrane lipoprotein carrier protein